MHPTTSTTYTPEQQAFIDATVARMKSEIVADMLAGRIPVVSTFGELHDHVDANEYGGFCEDSERADADNCAATLRGLDLVALMFPDAQGVERDTINTSAGQDACEHMQSIVSRWIDGGRGLIAAVKYFPGFEHDGMNIINPTCCDPRGAKCSPKKYGFEKMDTGGGFTGWVKDLPNGQRILLTDRDGTSHKLGTTFLLGISDANCNDIGIWEMQQGVAYNCPEDAVEGDDTPVNSYAD